MTDRAALIQAQRVLVELVLDEPAREQWREGPGAFARARLDDAASRDMVASLSAKGVEAKAFSMASKAAAAAARSDARGGDRDTSTGSTRGSTGTTAHARPARPPQRLAPDRRPGVACGYRPPLLPFLFGHLDLVDVWEHNVDWYLGDDAGRLGARELARFAALDPIALHSLGLSVGSVGCLADADRIDGTRRLVAAAGVDHVSDHLAVAEVEGRRLPQFFPLWRIEEQLELVVENVDRLQHRLGVRVILENPSMLLDPGGDLTTAQFLNEVCRRTGSGVLLDLENLRVNAANGVIDASRELEELEMANVLEVHLAGGVDMAQWQLVFDSHDHPVDEAVLTMLERLLPSMTNCCHVTVERDDRFEDAAEVVDDLRRLHEVIDAVSSTSSST